jgi:hypothetical protein
MPLYGWIRHEALAPKFGINRRVPVKKHHSRSSRMLRHKPATRKGMESRTFNMAQTETDLFPIHDSAGTLFFIKCLKGNQSHQFASIHQLLLFIYP